MTRQDEQFLFRGTLTSTRAAILLDGNLARFEAIWLSSSQDEFFQRLETFATAMGKTALRFHQDRDRIRSDVRLVVERIGYAWWTERATPIGTA